MRVGPGLGDRSPAARLGLFGAGLVVVLGGALALGRITGDAVSAQSADAPVQHRAGAGHGDAHGQGDTGGAHGASAAGTAAHGTTLSADGLRLDVPTTTVPANTATPFSFRVLDSAGEPVREYDLEQGKRMHLLVVSRDLSRSAHLHPELAADGTWRHPLTLSSGSYRAVADFATGGKRHTLAVDLVVPGPLQVAALPPPTTTATVGDLRVELERNGDRLSFTAYRTLTDVPVVPEPYLGSRGHLVAFRAGDLAYAHVHPAGEDGATTTYEADLPGAGVYRLFLELKVDGEVRTFPFTLEVTT